MKVLVTGAAGFIGMHTILALIKQNHDIVGIDNINDYYDVDLKHARLKECGVEGDYNKKTVSKRYNNYTFIKVCTVLNFPPKKMYNIYNIGASAPVPLMDFITEIEKAAGKTAIKEMCAMQPGDVVETYADVSGFVRDYNYNPSIGIEEGVANFVKWYKRVF